LALDGKPGQNVLKQMEKYGAKGLGYPENGFRNITNAKRPIKEPEDLKGLQMRVNNAKALNDMFKVMGASPQQIPVSELYTALESGVVDAQDHPISITLSFKLFEVQDYLSLSQHAYSPLVIAMNLKKFNKLTPEQQKIITDVAKEAIDLQRAMSVQKEDEMITTLEKDGMKVNRDVNIQAFQTQAKPVWKTFTDENGDTIINEILTTQKQP
jgi:tripartite ATP-independent transporter DctP family solute receptor